MEVEADKPKTGIIIGGVLAFLMVLAVLVRGVIEFFHHTVQDEMQEKVYSRVDSRLGDVRNAEQNKLNRYQWIDKNAGVVRIPVERALELTVKEGYHREAPPAAAPAPTAAAPTAPSNAAPAPAGDAPAPSAGAEKAEKH